MKMRNNTEQIEFRSESYERLRESDSTPVRFSYIRGNVEGMSLTEQVDNNIRRYAMLDPSQRERVIVGLSGGADSVCLLHVLRRLRDLGRWQGDLRAVYVHHGLRAAADEDERYVGHLCRTWDIPLSCVHVDAAAYAAEHGIGTEEAGHILRKGIFEESAVSWEREAPKEAEMVRIALAHHLEDRAETQLFHLCRGSDIEGLSGILPVSGRIIRPLISATREEIEAELTAEGIAWRIDETNEDTAYTRNLIRHEILPRLLRVNSVALPHMARLADAATETEAYLSHMTEEGMLRCRMEDAPLGITALNVPTLQREEPLIRKRILYLGLVQTCGRKKDIGSVHVEALLGLLASYGSATVDLPYACRGVRHTDVLAIVPAAMEGELSAYLEGRDFPCPTTAESFCTRRFPYGGDPSLIPRNEYTKWFDYDKIVMPVVFRKRKAGDRITLTTEGTSKPLSRYMIDEKIPKMERDRMCLPAAGEEILWVPGHRISAAFLVDDSTRNVLEISMIRKAENQHGRNDQRTDTGR